MSTITERWLECVRKKNSLLCAGLDPVESGQRDGKSIAGRDKLSWCLEFIEQVAPYAAAIKPNRNYMKDLSRDEMIELNEKIHSLGMISIDDSKIADIGETNDSGLYHAAKEGFDLVTYAPFPGNIRVTIEQARKHGVGLITLVLMSNPEFEVIKNAIFGQQKGFEYFASEVKKAGGEAVVIGAPSAGNHITMAEINRVYEIIGRRLVLVPGMGAQGGAVESILKIFGDHTIINVGRAIMNSPNPAGEARSYQQLINDLRD